MNNPPAFPLPENAKIDARTYGMTLRDYFQAAAMIGFLSCTDEEIARYAALNPDKCAEWSRQQADAMLKAREAE